MATPRSSRRPPAKRPPGSRFVAAEATHIVIREAAADDQHTFVAQRLQRLTDANVLAWIVALLQRQHHDRNVSVRVHQAHGHEGAMVEATLIVALHREACWSEQFGDARS